MTALVRLIEAWGKQNRFSQVTLILFVALMGIVFIGQAYTIEALKDTDWSVKILLGLFLLVVYRIAYWFFSYLSKIENKKLLEESKENMQKNKNLNT